VIDNNIVLVTGSKVAGRHFSMRLMDIGNVVVTSGNGRKSRVFMYELS
jgi:short-subunit dehydrogenase involved in D-alanine esterification of teichoic acids